MSNLFKKCFILMNMKAKGVHLKAHTNLIYLAREGQPVQITKEHWAGKNLQEGEYSSSLCLL